MSTIKKQILQAPREVIVGYKCDHCGKETKEEMNRLTYHHQEWLNDSVESFEYEHVCSLKCFIERIKYLYEHGQFIGKEYPTSEYMLGFGNGLIKEALIGNG